MFDAIRINKKLIIGPVLIFILIGIAILAIYISNKEHIGNEQGRADTQVYNCDFNNRYIDVSQCPGYANYANVTSANSATFFNNILAQVYTGGISDSEEVILHIPAANFYIYGDQEFIDLGSQFAYKNLTLEGVGNGPTFQVPPNYSTDMPALLLIDSQRHPTLKNLAFRSNNNVKFTSGAAIKIVRTNNRVIIDSIKCSGTKGVTESKRTGCLLVSPNANNQSAAPDSVTLINSEFSDINTGVNLFFLKQVTVRNNKFDNTNPNHGHKGANVQLVLYSINKDDGTDWSVVENNQFYSANKCTDVGGGLTQCDLSHGQTQLGLIGQSNKVRIRSNTFIGAQDTTIYVSPHNPGTAIGTRLGCVASGFSREVIIENNIIQGSKLASIGLHFQPDQTACATGGADKFIIRDNQINGLVEQQYINQYPQYLQSNNSTGDGGGILIHDTAHAPITGLDVYNNSISNFTQVGSENWAQTMSGSCMDIGGLRGKNNNAEDIKFYNNTLTNCKLGIYFYKAFWPLVNEVDGTAGPVNHADYGTHSTSNNYLTLFENKIIQTNPAFSDILYQSGAYKGIENVSTLQLKANETTSTNNTANGAKRCNISCTSNSNCLSSVPVINSSYQTILGGYANGFSCYQGTTCRNTTSLSDSDCDLNNSYNPANPGAIAGITFNPGTTTFTDNITVRLASTTFGADIHYTLDGTTPTESSSLYISPIYINSTTTVKAKAFRFRYTPTSVATATYTKQTTQTVATPVINPNGGTFTNSINVNLSTSTAGAEIHYTTDNSTPTESSSLYSGQLTFTETTVLKAKAFKSGLNPSAVATATFTKQTPPATVATPTFQPNGGSFTNSVTVAISTSTSGAQIRYTTNGSEPSESSSLYSGPLNFTSTTTLKAKAYKSGMNPSNTASAVYTKEVPGIVNPPVFQPNGGTFTNSISVSISTSTSGATIRYTTNGSEPSESSTQYSNPLTFSSTTTLKAKAFKSGMTASSTTTATYTKETPPPGSYNFTINTTFHFSNIPFTVEFLNQNNSLVHSEIVNVNSGKLIFTVSQNELPTGNYKLNLSPRYFTTLSKNISLNTTGNVNITVSGDFLGGSFSRSSNNTKVTLVDLAFAINYFRANDRSKDLDGDNKFSVSDLAIVIHSFRASR